MNLEPVTYVQVGLASGLMLVNVAISVLLRLGLESRAADRLGPHGSAARC